MPLQVDSFVFDELSADPASPEEGQIWFNTTTKLLKIHKNSTTRVLAVPSDTNPDSLGSASAGTASEVARQDHVHGHGDLSGGSLHSAATGSVSGFFSSADKTKLDNYTANISIEDSSGTDPAGGSDGDLYYNTDMNLWMFYDGSRSKWLSKEVIIFQIGRDGRTAPGSFYRTVDRQTMTNTLGFVAPYNGTVGGFAYTRSDTDSATFEIRAAGSSITTLASSAGKGYSSTLDGNFSQNDVISVQNQTGGNATSSVSGTVLMRWRDT